MAVTTEQDRVLVTGATGYVGGRLVPRLLDAGYTVRAVSRSPEKLRDRPWAEDRRVELTAADAFDLESMKVACANCSAAYYLIHSMGSNATDFAEADRTAATNMARAAGAQDLDRIIYLGGLGESGDHLSKHLRSRAEVADILREGTVPVTVLRGAVIIGSGSASFETLRYLVERLPVMTTPKWVQTRSQPIAIENVLNYLTGCLESDATTGETFDIGGPEILTYAELMQTYARAAGLPRRWIIPLPVLTPKLSSYWIHLVTPVPASIARPLVEGLRNPAICRDDRIREIIPQELLTAEEAITRALEKIRSEDVVSRWSDAGEIPDAAWADETDPDWAGGDLFEDRRAIEVDDPIDCVWERVVRIGGHQGWYFAGFLWTLRGWLDRLVGGVGLRRGRRHPAQLETGDALDFWRVQTVEAPNHLRLVAEMKLPGEATLEFRLSRKDEQTRLEQIARFRPRGLFGLIYWYLVYPFHQFIFSGMLHNLAHGQET